MIEKKSNLRHYPLALVWTIFVTKELRMQESLNQFEYYLSIEKLTPSNRIMKIHLFGN